MSAFSMSRGSRRTGAATARSGLACTLARSGECALGRAAEADTVLVARLTCDCIQQVFAAWADALGSEFFPMEAPAWARRCQSGIGIRATRWEEVYDPDRIELLAAEMRELIALLERRTAAGSSPPGSLG
jgi:benzoyl-CoA reductase subunit B